MPQIGWNEDNFVSLKFISNENVEVLPKKMCRVVLKFNFNKLTTKKKCLDSPNKIYK